MPMLCFDTVLSIPPFFVPFLVLYLTLPCLKSSPRIFTLVRHIYIHIYLLTSTAHSLVDSPL